MRTEIAATRGGRCLVEEREALVDPSRLDEGASLSGEREHLPVPVADAFGDRIGLVEELRRRVEIPAEHRGQRLRQDEPAALGRVGLAFEQALGVREPAARDRELSPSLVVPRQCQRHPCRSDLVPGSRVRGVRALAQRDRRVELPLPPARLGVELEVACGELARVDVGVGGMRLPPREPGRSFARGIEVVDHLRHGDHAV